MEVEREEPPKKYMKYEGINRELAVQEVKTGNLSISQASRKYQVPITTLHDYLRDKHVKSPKKRGPKNILKSEEESKISEWLIKCGEMGDPRTEEDLKIAASKIRQSRCENDTPKFKNDLPSSKWIKHFQMRNQEVTIRKPEAVTRAAANVTEGYIRNFFEHMYCFLYIFF